MATPLSNTTQALDLRLECLKLAHRPGLSPHEVISIAREYLAWVAPVPITQATEPDDSQKAGKNTTAPTRNARTSLPTGAAKAATT